MKGEKSIKREERGKGEKRGKKNIPIGRVKRRKEKDMWWKKVKKRGESS